MARTSPESRRRIRAGQTAAVLIALMFAFGIGTWIASDNHTRPTRQAQVTGLLTENPRSLVDQFGHGYTVAIVDFPTVTKDPHIVLNVSGYSKKGDSLKAYRDLENDAISLDQFPDANTPNKLVPIPLWIMTGFGVAALVMLMIYWRLRRKCPPDYSIC